MISFKLLGERKICKYVLKTISTNGEEILNKFSLINLFDWSSQSNRCRKLLSIFIEIVTMTVTESGYYISENNELDLHNEKIKKDHLEDKER